MHFFKRYSFTITLGVISVLGVLAGILFLTSSVQENTFIGKSLLPFLIIVAVFGWLLTFIFSFALPENRCSGRLLCMDPEYTRIMIIFFFAGAVLLAGIGLLIDFARHRRHPIDKN